MRKDIYFHIGFWVIMCGMHLGFSLNVMPIKIALIATSINIFHLMLTFYFNILWVFPRFYKMRISSKYLFISILVILCISGSQFLADYNLFEKHGNPPKDIPFPSLLLFFRNLFWIALSYLVSTAFMLQDRLKKQEIKTQVIIKDKLKTELDLLKAQINPHFLFNALNNIYSLSYMKSTSAPDSILKLSDMLRYVIEDCSYEKVSLDSEIKYIENYISFQQMKSPDNQNIKFNPPVNGKQTKIAPMLFIPFIENSFKYSRIEEYPNAFIEMNLTDNEKYIKFLIINSIPTAGKASSGSGKGIKNVKQRLNIIYPQKHNLRIEEKNNVFSVQLKIEF